MAQPPAVITIQYSSKPPAAAPDSNKPDAVVAPVVFDTTVTMPVPPPHAHLTCVLKRFLAAKSGVHPTLQRIRYAGGELKYPPSLVMERRGVRQLTWTITVEAMSAAELERDFRATLLVDPEDTILDLKFFLAATVGVEPDFQRLFVHRKQQKLREPLDDNLTLRAAGLESGSLIRIMYEVPSVEAGHGSVHRTQSKLRSSFMDTGIPTPGPSSVTVLPKPGTVIAELTTVQQIFRMATTRYATRPFLGTRGWPKATAAGKDVKTVAPPAPAPGAMPVNTRTAYEWQSYAAVAARVTNVAAGLLSLGLKKGATISIMSINRSEWVISDLACAVQGFVSVPLYDTLGADAAQYIIQHASVQAVVVSREKLHQITRARADSKNGECDSLRYVVVMDDYPGDRAWVQATDRKVAGFTHTFSELEAAGKQNSANYSDAKISPDDLLTLAYTSGTTGNPKGVMLTHRNIVSIMSSLVGRFPKEYMAPNETVISYLPLAHIYERVMEANFLCQGHAVGFYQGDQKLLLDDIQELKPSFFPGVPRVWNLIYERVNTQLAQSNAIRRSVFARAFAARHADMMNLDYMPDNSLWDTVVFKKVSERLGGRLKLISSGAAPLASRVAEYMHIAFKSTFAEGYGLTETSAGGTATDYKAVSWGNVGTPVACTEVKLVDVEDMNYLVTDKPNPRGEIWIRGPCVCAGYYKQPELTAESITADGWFKTGDVGQWLPSGDLQIIDRKKALFKLAQGEYIRPEYIEGCYKQNSLIANIYVHGTSVENCLVAIVVPNFEVLAAWAKANNLAAIANKPDDLVKSEAVKAMILAAMNKKAKDEKLQGFEIVKDIHLVAEDFSVENGCLTPTFKLKRAACAQLFAAPIAALYVAQAKLAPPPSAGIMSKL